jgi:hypothetical protein
MAWFAGKVQGVVVHTNNFSPGLTNSFPLTISKVT